MPSTDLLIQTKLTPPQPRRQWLARPRLDALLRRATEVPLTVVVAGTGYGKSTTLAGFCAARHWPCAWYSLADEDADAPRFLRHLIGALGLVQPGVGSAALALLGASWNPALGERAIDLLCNDLLEHVQHDLLLVLDDVQHVDRSPVAPLIDRLLTRATPRVHIVLAARRVPRLTNLLALRARGCVLEIGQSDLAFTADEVGALFAAQQRAIDAEAAALLVARTEGWPMALQLLCQGLSAATGEDVTAFLGRESTPLQALFEYLAAEVLGVQAPEIQQFLLRSAILRTLHPALCDAALDRPDSARLLDQLHAAALFVYRVGAGNYRYHPLFQEFLLLEARRRGVDQPTLHRRAAAWLRLNAQHEEAIYHALAGGDGALAADLLEAVALDWAHTGRAVTLQSWLDRLPPELLDRSPTLLYAQGEVARLLSHFDAALGWYARAEARWTALDDPIGRSRALQGQAQVFLDTVRPAPAEHLLKRALRLLGRDHRPESAALLHLLGENTTNRGRAALAARLHAAAERVWPDARTPLLTAARVELRTGRIIAARGRLQAEIERTQHAPDSQPPEAHREPLMLLSLLACWVGDPQAARAYAERGLRRGRAISSPIVEAVGEIRLGHSLQIGGDADAAAACYRRAVSLADEFGVARTKAEPLMGQVLLAGTRGDLLGAELVARDALAIVQRTGDEWMAALLWLALGAAAVFNRRSTAALDALDAAQQRFATSGDTYGVAACHLWRALALLGDSSLDAARDETRTLLLLVRAHEYDFLIVRPTLFTPRDRQMLAPLLLLGVTIAEVADYARELLAHAFPELAPIATTAPRAPLAHPGVTLHVQVLGQFRVWRGVEEIRAWGREKARQLLQLLITRRSGWLQRDQIIDLLWPDTGASAAAGQFKVALNALVSALEPNRPPHAPSFYIRRNGSAYRFLPPPGSVSIDVDAFERAIDQADSAVEPDRRIARYAEALALYSGDYLSDSLYEDWVSATRDQQLRRYLGGAYTLAQHLLDRGDLAGAIRWAETILARDPCWEAAYRLLMRAYTRQGNRPQALRAYDRCVHALDADLGIAPLPETTRLRDALLVSDRLIDV